jgi:phosphoribosylformylglycinamidine (FGAM) synthase-like enzyme
METLLAEALDQVDLAAEALQVVEILLAEALQERLTLAVAVAELELEHLHKYLLPVQQPEHLEDQVL